MSTWTGTAAVPDKQHQNRCKPIEIRVLKRKILENVWKSETVVRLTQPQASSPKMFILFNFSVFKVKVIKSSK